MNPIVPRNAISRRAALAVIGMPLSIPLALRSETVKTVRFDSVQSIWDELNFNRLKRKRFIAGEMLAEISPVKLFMVLEGKNEKETLGTIVVCDQDAGPNPASIAYVAVLKEAKPYVPPLDDLEKGERLVVYGAVFALNDKGSGTGENTHAVSVHMFGGFHRLKS